MGKLAGNNHFEASAVLFNSVRQSPKFSNKAVLRLVPSITSRNRIPLKKKFKRASGALFVSI